MNKTAIGQRARLMLAGLVMAAPLVTLPAAVEARLPDTLPLTVDLPGQSLVLSSCGVRNFMFHDLYSVAIYLPEPTVSVAMLRDHSVPKIIALQVLYEGGVPDRLPADWQRELRSNVSADLLYGMQSAYSAIGAGDVMSFIYTPGGGTTIAVNGHPAASEPGHGLIDAMLNIWIGPNAVTPDLKRALLRGGC